MSCSIVTVTAGGAALGQRVADYLRQGGDQQLTLHVPAWLAPDFPEAQAMEGRLRDLVGLLFTSRRKLIMIMATGIVVRLIAPHLRDKLTDPAVVVLDERGQYAISLLSGHLGGANDLARDLALGLDLTPVITTATDVCGVPAIDLVARDYGLVLDPPEAVRTVNSALLHGRPVRIYTEHNLALAPVPGLSIQPWPQLSAAPTSELNDHCLVLVTNRSQAGLPAAATLFLRPRNLVAGVGCRKDVSPETVAAALGLALAQCGRSALSLRALATVDLRAHEPALMINAAQLGIPLLSFARAALDKLFALKHLDLQYSEFVKNTIGVGGVCEPAALLAGQQARLILKKMKHQGVTVAIAEDASGSWEQDPVPQRT